MNSSDGSGDRMGAREEWVATLGGKGYDLAAISAALQQGGVQALCHGTEFTGRPGTQLRVLETAVVKLRLELQPRNASEARSFVLRAVERERLVGVHHPDKTWFLHFEPGASVPVIGNMTPLLRPLHSPEALGSGGEGAFEDLLGQMIELYIRIAAAHDVGLDISLSNFAIDSEGRLFYIDDDFYSWDEFNTLSQFLGVLIRSRDTLDEEVLRRLASRLRRAILDGFGDPIWISVVAQELRGLFVPPVKQPLIQTLVAALLEKERPASSAAPVPAIALVPAPVSAAPKPADGRLAILGDIHANAPALQAVLSELDRLGVTDGIVVGDIVGYGPHPQACVELLAARPALRCVKGNHDHAVATGYFAMGFSSLAKWVIEWSIGRMTAEAIAFLDQLPLELLGESWLAVHGSPTDKRYFNAYVYEMTYEENLENLVERGVSRCFHGHTHLQKVYYRSRDNREGANADALQSLQPYLASLVCPGSVGQPRCGKPGAEFALYDPRSGELELLRLDYDMTPVIEDMRRFSFPDSLVERLQGGR